MSDKSMEGQDQVEIPAAKQPEDSLSPKGKSAMQGLTEQKIESSVPSETIEPPNPSKKGSDFESWAREELFEGNAKRIIIYPEDNRQLNKLGDGIGLTKERRITDAYWKEDGSIWELKSGYQKGGIDQDQLYEYSLMEQAGEVRVREGGNKIKLPVTSINYLFDTKAGALANQSGEANFWYLDENKNVQHLE